MLRLELVIKGRPITKKNSQIIITTPTGKKFLIPKKAYRDYEKEACKSIKEHMDYWRDGGFKTIEGKVHVRALYWMPNRRGWPDLLGVEEATADILEAKNKKLKERIAVISNDNNIISWDGSRLMGVDPENPRVEIMIEWEQSGE